MLKPEHRHSVISNLEHVAIIGGGIAAVCLTYELLQQNPKLLIDIYCADNAIAQGASGNRQGAVYPLLQGKNSPLAALNCAAYQYALDFYLQMEQHTNTKHFYQTGVLQQAFTGDLQSRYQQITEFFPKVCTFVDDIESSRLAGLELPYSSLWFAKGGWLEPFSFCQNALSYLTSKHKVNVHLNHRITTLSNETATKTSNGKGDKLTTIVDPHSARWGLGCDDHSIAQKYDAVAICAGHLSSKFEQTKHISIDPIRGQVSQLSTTTPLNKLKTTLCHKGYVTPSQGEYQCFGATYRHNDANTEVRETETDHNVLQVKQVYEQQHWAHSLSKNDVIADRACIRATSIDHLPIAGEVFPNNWVLKNIDKNNGKLMRKDKLAPNNLVDPDGYHTNPTKGLYTITGLGARGLTTGPLMAKYVASIMTAENNQSSSTLTSISASLPTELISAISPMRFQIRQLKRDKDRIEQMWQ
ncbi:FAD-dependent 5-carboxymethylaminomethyl-2-thiouridine(34) oxidoreductase MnmC [Psychrosphaera sp. B3R10]|uniref:FAD-dependent 5-carboxymethylaminomethyl-2-thiouridine(34) oxidoreductase MnmC n=1 Tax=unclassified Psychrosphaera TaxID=2641570 RepID=UPI001C083D8C|nr:MULTISPECIES: FAD-dependent 5-carboxymethylaminomethyl-2-thiouridine(34) oxidoreductase MnmC [unclassified Psychrosphaera]MBU2880922.1 FAD-dependent 5-carboxymethylaminomethyl-2-thiouridine(34) oxidoreductase MnmC [Psychrosphaera sp. I2R16]MBU2990859.1 FAD-dependent 5-carboxymethylaminomethyl-2-thiouridine(34) oxidoreductase MnmC [Psychrosphaera sp. B3R10]